MRGPFQDSDGARRRRDGAHVPVVPADEIPRWILGDHLLDDATACLLPGTLALGQDSVPCLCHTLLLGRFARNASVPAGAAQSPLATGEFPALDPSGRCRDDHTPRGGIMPVEARTLSGKCECGAVRYGVADEFRYAANCHCSNCRASTGSAFKPFAGIERDKLAITKGADTLLVWGDDDGNHTRCGICGSLLYSVVRDGEYVHVAMGSLADEPSVRPTEHIFVGSKAPWSEITDDLPQNVA